MQERRPPSWRHAFNFGPGLLRAPCKVVLPLLESDLFEVMTACCEGHLADTSVQWSTDSAVTVVMAAKGSCSLPHRTVAEG